MSIHRRYVIREAEDSLDDRAKRIAQTKIHRVEEDHLPQVEELLDRVLRILEQFRDMGGRSCVELKKFKSQEKLSFSFEEYELKARQFRLKFIGKNHSATLPIRSVDEDLLKEYQKLVKELDYTSRLMYPPIFAIVDEYNKRNPEDKIDYPAKEDAVYRMAKRKGLKIGPYDMLEDVLTIDKCPCWDGDAFMEVVEDELEKFSSSDSNTEIEQMRAIAQKYGLDLNYGDSKIYFRIPGKPSSRTRGEYAIMDRDVATPETIEAKCKKIAQKNGLLDNEPEVDESAELSNAIYMLRRAGFRLM